MFPVCQAHHCGAFNHVTFVHQLHNVSFTRSSSIVNSYIIIIQNTCIIKSIDSKAYFPPDIKVNESEHKVRVCVTTFFVVVFFRTSVACRPLLSSSFFFFFFFFFLGRPSFIGFCFVFSPQSLRNILTMIITT